MFVVTRGYGGSSGSLITRGFGGKHSYNYIVTRGYGIWTFTHYVVTRGYTPNTGSSTGPLQFVFIGNSDTVGDIVPYNDGVINVTSFSVRGTQFRTAISQACIDILNQTGAVGQPYKLAIIKNGTTLFTLRSIIWGTRCTTSETQPDYQVIDKQLTDSTYT